MVLSNVFQQICLNILFHSINDVHKNQHVLSPATHKYHLKMYFVSNFQKMHTFEKALELQ